MLDINDKPIIKRALERRLNSEPGVSVWIVEVRPFKHRIAVDLFIMVDDWIKVEAGFDLDPLFDLVKVHNQADEIAEQCKEARRVMGPRRPVEPGDISEVRYAKGTGRASSRGHHLKAPRLIIPKGTTIQ